MHGRIQFDLNTPMVPPYGRIFYNYTNPMWIPNAVKNAQSNCMKGPRKQNRIDILDWTLEIREVSLILNLDTEEISYMEQNYHATSTKENVYRHLSQKQQQFGNPKHIANYSN